MLGLVSPYEFSTLRIPLLRGRLYDDSEVMRAAHVALVNQAFIKQFLGDRDPIGQPRPPAPSVRGLVRGGIIAVGRQTPVSPRRPRSVAELGRQLGMERKTWTARRRLRLKLDAEPSMPAPESTWLVMVRDVSTSVSVGSPFCSRCWVTVTTLAITAAGSGNTEGLSRCRR